LKKNIIKQLQDAESWIIKVVNKIIDKRIISEGFIKLFPVKVMSINIDETINVAMLDDLINIIPNIKNKATDIIGVNDIVYCIAINRSMSNFFIAYKI